MKKPSEAVTTYKSKHFRFFGDTEVFIYVQI